MKTMIIIALLLSGCGTGTMKFYNPQMKTSLECAGGVGWQAQTRNFAWKQRWLAAISYKDNSLSFALFDNWINATTKAG